jgi:hypothetical protein
MACGPVLGNIQVIGMTHEEETAVCFAEHQLTTLTTSTLAVPIDEAAVLVHDAAYVPDCEGHKEFSGLLTFSVCDFVFIAKLGEALYTASR